MIFKCWNLDTNQLVYKYNEPGDLHQCENIEKFDFTENKNKCGDNRFYISKKDEKSNLFFAFCIDNIKVSKPAKFIVKHAINMFLSVNPVLAKKQLEYEEIVKASIHNTRNLNSSITSKILNGLNETHLSMSRNKTKYIEDLIINNTHQFAKEILSILKISSQISSEYNVIDYLKPNIKILKSEFSSGKVHSLLVLAFYNLEEDFISKNIKVNINSTHEYAYYNFNTTQTVLHHIFSNAFNYCKKNSVININTSIYNEEYIEISFTMESLYLTDEIISEGLLNGERDGQAVKLHPKGTGLGLGIINRLIGLNNGTFYFNRINDKKINEGNYVFGYNLFKIRLLRNEFY